MRAHPPRDAATRGGGRAGGAAGGRGGAGPRQRGGDGGAGGAPRGAGGGARGGAGRGWRKAGAELVRAARGADARARLPWYGVEMSALSFVTARLMETWSHGLDVVDVVGIPRPDTDRLRHVVFLGVRTREFSYVNRGL